MDDATKQALLGAIRHILTALGGILVARGVIDSSGLNDLIGALMVILPIIWSMWDKYRAERDAKEREKAAVQAGVVAARTNQLRGVAAADISHDKAQELIHSMREQVG